MEREIIFRGKTLEKGEWVEGFYSHSPSGNHYITRTSGTGCAHPCKVDPSTVGQYTGVKEKNGKKIFEFDTLKGLYLFGMEVKGTVFFEDGAFGVGWMRGDAKMFSPFTSVCNVSWEVIGNVCD